jgi:hypothetical protein
VLLIRAETFFRPSISKAPGKAEQERAAGEDHFITTYQLVLVLKFAIRALATPAATLA